MPPRLLQRLGVVATTVIMVASMTTLASATTIASGSTGFDISFPQCAGPYPSAPGFGIVGVNDGHVFSVNPCLASELAWAQRAANGSPSFYVNTGDPGPAHTTAWPSNQSSPKVCYGANSVPCAYDYGWNAARTSYGAAVAAEATNGSSTPDAAANAATWWLDVETGNAWETIESDYGPTANSRNNDTAMLEGMLAYLASAGVTSTGIYSTSLQFREIAGPVQAGLTGVTAWVPGAGSLAAAQAKCLTPSFTGGRVAMTQYPSQGYDGNYVCGLVSTPASAATSVAATATYSDQLTTTNNAGAVTYTQTAGQPALLVSATGLVTTSGVLATGTYLATGTTVDAAGDSGAFSFTLSVGILTQTSPTTGSVKASGATSYSATITMSGVSGTATFIEVTGQPALLVSPSGLVTTSGALAAGTYTTTGTVTDAAGDTGTYTFSLNVGALKQRAPTTGTTNSAASATYSVQLDVGANLGAVSFLQTSGQPSLLVSSSGLVTTSGVLPAGTYNVGGTTSDPTGDVGAFIFTLVVSGALAPPTPSTPPSGPVATGVVGHAVAGRTEILYVNGVNFYGQPKITSHAGTSVLVTRDTGRALTLRVNVRAHSRAGTFTFTIAFAHGQACRVRYQQR